MDPFRAICSAGKREASFEAAALPRQQIQPPAMKCRDAVGDGETEPRTRGAAARFVPESSDPEGRELDPAGLLTGAVAITGVTFAGPVPGLAPIARATTFPYIVRQIQTIGIPPTGN